ncbi:uncharacterized protein LOC131648119 [Vicia villosa]|uniref:uncharacterized protein LOC131648119 n=1 Tax=Vicia villosa TaxID=3911 RepID=UPI00273B60D4|nr:uncharacterized protein LOC131648119 [Vicia villosa]
MFALLFGWSKASKCKKAIKKAKCRIRFLKNKRQTIVKQLRNDLAELIQHGHEEAALNRVEQLINDESLADAYELLEKFCEFILSQFSYIQKHKECPDDIKVAISSLIFASARCGNIPELSVIRKIFGKRYGEKFAKAAVELYPGNLVNKQLAENLSEKYVTEDLRYAKVNKIARENKCLQQNVLAIEYYPEWQPVQHIVENDPKINATISESKVHPSQIDEVEKDLKCDSCNTLPKSTFVVDSSAVMSIVPQYPQYILSYPMQDKFEKIVEVDFPKLLSSDMVDYVDEVEEYQFSLPKYEACHDEMLLNFNSSRLSGRDRTRYGFDESDIDQYDSMCESLSTMTSRRSKRTPRKRSKRRPSSIKNIGIIDIGYMVYYQKPCRKVASVHDSRKDQKKRMLRSDQPRLCLAEEEEVSLLQHSEVGFESQLEELPCLEQDNLTTTNESAENQIKSEDSTRRINFNRKIKGCSLDKPCYYYLYDDTKDSLETQPLIEATSHVEEDCHCRPFCEDGNNGIGNNETKEEIIDTSSVVSNPKMNGSLREETEVQYSRAMTMPQERHREGKDKMFRTYSCQQYPNHVHPKLPDYDDIAVKFTALKRDHLQNKDYLRK